MNHQPQLGPCATDQCKQQRILRSNFCEDHQPGRPHPARPLMAGSRLRQHLNLAARDTLGHALPASVKISISGNRITLIGPPATGKTRTARTLLSRLGSKVRVFSGTSDRDIQEDHL